MNPPVIINQEWIKDFINVVVGRDSQKQEEASNPNYKIAIPFQAGSGAVNVKLKTRTLAPERKDHIVVKLIKLHTLFYGN